MTVRRYGTDPVEVADAERALAAAAGRDRVVWGTEPDASPDAVWVDHAGVARAYVDLGPGPRVNHVTAPRAYRAVTSTGTLTSLGIPGSAPFPAQGGDAYTVMVRYRGPANPSARSIIHAASAAGVILAQPQLLYTDSPDWTWHIFRLHVPEVAGVVELRLPALFYGTHAGTYEIDRVLFAPGHVTDYFDGDTLGASWTGTPHASTSVYDGPGWVALSGPEVTDALAVAVQSREPRWLTTTARRWDGTTWEAVP